MFVAFRSIIVILLAYPHAKVLFSVKPDLLSVGWKNTEHILSVGT